MATDFDTPPFYDALIKDKPDYMSALWIAWIESFGQTLDGYLTSHGMYVPRLTQSQRNAIQQPSSGQMIYNTTIEKAQIWENDPNHESDGQWKTFTTV